MNQNALKVKAMFKARDIVQVSSADHRNKMGVVVSSDGSWVYVRLYDEIFPYYFQPAELRLMNSIYAASISSV